MTVCKQDHCGGAVGALGFGVAGAEETWRSCIDKLAAFPNVYMKVGGLQMVVNGFGLTQKEGRESPPTNSTELAALTFEIYSYVINAFTPARCM